MAVIARANWSREMPQGPSDCDGSDLRMTAATRGLVIFRDYRALKTTMLNGDHPR